MPDFHCMSVAACDHSAAIWCDDNVDCTDADEMDMKLRGRSEDGEESTVMERG